MLDRRRLEVVIDCRIELPQIEESAGECPLPRMWRIRSGVCLTDGPAISHG